MSLTLYLRRLSILKITRIFILLLPLVASADDLDHEFWEKQYRHCLDTSDLVVIGKFKSNNLIESKGYHHYEMTIEVLYSLKNYSDNMLVYHSWYEDKSVENRNKEGLFCLCNDEGGIYDPSGNNVYPIDNHLTNYARNYMPQKNTENWRPLCEKQIGTDLK